MNIKDISEGFGKVLDSKEYTDEIMDFIGDADIYLEECADEAKEIILSTLKEMDFARLMGFAQKTVSAKLTLEGSEHIILADMSGELRKFTHTVVLCVIGALIKDEIL